MAEHPPAAPASTTWPPRRDVRPEEMYVIHRLALKFPDLATVEKELEELERRRKEGNVVGLPNARPAGLDGLRLKVKDAERLLDKGRISLREFRDLIGLPYELDGAEPVPREPDRHLVERVCWGTIWRVSPVALLPLVFDVRLSYQLAAGGALLLALAVGVPTGWWRARSFLGSLWRLGAALAVVYVAYHLPLWLAVGILVTVAFALLGDAVWLVLRAEPPPAVED